jgi:hypothetical protein
MLANFVDDLACKLLSLLMEEEWTINILCVQCSHAEAINLASDDCEMKLDHLEFLRVLEYGKP